MTSLEQETLREFCGVLRQIHRLSVKRWADSQSILGEKLEKEVYQSYETLIKKFPPIETGKMESTLMFSPKSHDLSLRIEEGCFYLPPVDEDAEFIITLSVDCNMKMPRTNVRIEMNKLSPDDLRTIGYRFELGADPHDYFHTTLSNRRVAGDPLSACPLWLPCEIPRIPISARNPVSMIVCIIIALYGKEGYKRMRSEGLEVAPQYLVGLEHILKQ